MVIDRDIEVSHWNLALQPEQQPMTRGDSVASLVSASGVEFGRVELSQMDERIERVRQRVHGLPFSFS